MRLSQDSFEQIDDKIKNHKVQRLKAVERTTIIRTDLMRKEQANMSTMNITETNDKVDLELEEDMVATGVLKKK